jgi:hypothetical protein
MGRNTVPIITLPEPAISHPRTKVDSSCLTHIGYHEPLKYLYLTYKSTGLSYVYPNVPKDVYDTLVTLSQTGGSIGKYVTGYIKPNFPAIDVNNQDA